MGKTTSLMVLVKSLTKAEKRHFRLYSSLQSGEKIYLYLFDLIEHNTSRDALHAQFCMKYDKKSFDIAVKHLYQTVLDSLVLLRGKSDMQTKIFNLISEANILFERKLSDEAIIHLNKAKKLTTIYEIDTLALLIRRTELKYMNAMDFNHISERQLVAKQMKVVETMNYNKSANLHSQLYDILKHRLIYKGYVRSDKQKQELNDLVLSELNLTSNNSYKGFEAQKLHLLFQATYYLNSGYYKTAIRLYQKLISLFEENKHMIMNPPIYYLQSILGILNSLMALSLYAEMPFFVNKLKEIEQGDFSSDFILSVRTHVFLYEFSCAFNTGNFTSATNLISGNEESLYKKISLLGLEMQLNILLCTTILDLATGNTTSARKNMRKIIGSGKLFYTLPAYRHARLLNLILQSELNNYDFFDNEIKAIKRSIRFEKQISITEKMLFRFIQNYHMIDQEKVRNKLLRQLKNETVKIHRNKYELQLLAIFDFLSWMESKLTLYSFQKLLAEKNIR